MSLFGKLKRYLRIAWGDGALGGGSGWGGRTGPRILVLFVTSVCNLRCAHCFVGDALNRPGDLDLAEVQALSAGWGPVDNLLVSGGEPFACAWLVDALATFYQTNGTRLFSIPTNGTLGSRTVSAITALAERCPQASLHLYVSLDGLAASHDAVRGKAGTFDRALATLDALVQTFADHRQIGLAVTCTVTNRNIDEVAELALLIRRRFGGRVAFNLNLLRGNPTAPDLALPDPAELHRVYRQVQQTGSGRRWPARVIADALFRLQLDAARQARQPVPCQAGKRIGVVYPDGAVAACELLPPHGSWRETPDPETLWRGAAARDRRQSIRRGACSCTHGCFLGPSLIYHPFGPGLVLWHALRLALTR